MAQVAGLVMQPLLDRAHGKSAAAREARAATVSDLFFAHGNVVLRQPHATC
jgi:hypothetical protein